MKKAVSFLAILLMIVGIATAQNPMSGSYTISTDATQNPDFSSLQSAVNALVSAGAVNGVEFHLLPGTYYEFINIPEISSLSQDNRLVIKGVGGSFHDVVITGNAGYTSNPIVKLNGCDYISFANLKIATSSAHYANLVVFENGVNYITFDNVYFLGADVTANTLNNDKQLVYDNSKESFDRDIHFLHCHFVNGYIALYLQGKNVITPLDKNLIVKDCVFENQYSKSIYATFQENLLISGNKINNNKDLKDGFQGIDIYWVQDSVGISVIENNVVSIDYNIRYATGIEVRPGIGSAQTPLIIRNNMIRIKSSKDLNYGFSFSHNRGSYIHLAHNSVLFEENTGGSLVFVNNNVDYLGINNNLLVNNGRGYIYRFQKAMPNRIAGYNRILVNEEVKIGRVGATELVSLPDWQEFTEGLDLTSAKLSSNPFISNSNLHILSSEYLKVANPLDYVLKDIDGEARSLTQPCAGADELAPAIDLPPYLLNPLSNIVFEVFPDSVWLDLSQTFTDPDNDDDEIELSISANSNPSLVEVGFALNNRSLLVKRLVQEEGIVVVNVLALSNGKSAEASFMVECTNEDLPPVVVNPIEPVVFMDFPQSVQIDLHNTFSDPDSPIQLMELSIQNFTSSNFSAVLSNNTLILNRLGFAAFENESVTIRCSSQGLYVETEVLVSGQAVMLEKGIAHMEDVLLSAEGIWIPLTGGENTMMSNGWGFYNYHDTYFWGGFTASNSTDASLVGYSAQYTAATLAGHENSSKYAVAYTEGFPVDVKPLDGVADSVRGCYVTNNLWVWQAVLQGDGLNPTPFGGATGNDPDYLRIFAVGKNADNLDTDTLYFYLADYRFEDNSLDYVLDTWEWFDLSALGLVKSVRFGLQSTKVNNWGMTTPAYFCMDDFNGIPPVVSDMLPYVANPLETILLNQFPQSVSLSLVHVVSDPDDDDELIDYQLLESSNSEDFEVGIDSKVLYVSRLTNLNSEAVVLVRAISNGQSVDFELNISATSTLNVRNIRESFVLYPNPSSDFIRLDFSGTRPSENQSYTFVIYCNTGKIVRNGSLQTGIIDIRDLLKGTYIFQLRNEKGQSVMEQVFVKI